MTTRITSPAKGSKVSWPFDAQFSVSAADVSATSSGTVLLLSVCVGGQCYLEGKLEFTDGVPDPRTISLGSTKEEGNHVAWSLRLDRISQATYDKLVKEKEGKLADGTWGAEGSSMSLLNATPVSKVTVTKSV
ncbi:hypothetical protein [Krasilnikovia sp. MM14-A1259]|uniref:hypothetical protein n=1 Tax=Krasilnikovia sp. MM14-A1259 TaxID=3373539 RepID=UPI00382B24FD